MTDTPVATAVEVAAACPTCGEPIVAGDRFCEACGSELPLTEAAPAQAVLLEEPVAVDAPVDTGVTCPSCGNVGEPVEGYCGTCGMRLPAPRDHVEQELEGVAGVTDKGLRHHRNEDAMALFVGDGFVAAVVCDGVSTTVDPDKASQAAADAAVAVLSVQPDHDAAYDAARAAVLATTYETSAKLGPPSCTYLAALVTDERVTFATLGDCRSYWVTPGSATQLTVDDSWAEVQIAAGAMSRADAYAHPNAHVITRWLANDADPAWRPTMVEFPVPGPGRLLLVSDGLWNYTIEPGQLVAAAGPTSGVEGPGGPTSGVEGPGGPTSGVEGPSGPTSGVEGLSGPTSGVEGPLERLALARRLVTYANESGGSDNITVVVVDLPLENVTETHSDLKGSPAS